MSVVGRFSGLLLISLLAFTACSEDDDGDYVLVWADEFDGTAGTPPNPERWTYDFGDGCPSLCGWGNQELQAYTARAENVSHDGQGHLVITARAESFGNSEFTSARIRTQGLFSQRYGRFEARIRLPRGNGIWPAFWMLGDDITSVGWPQCGEIDVMEYRGQETDTSFGTVHGPAYSGGQSIGERFVLDNTSFDAGFHVFAVEWTEERITWFVDGTPFHRVRPQDLNGREWVFDDPFFLILNVAVGGTFAGCTRPDCITPSMPQEMVIDWVRVYQKS